jgi:hypothetical protein
MLSGELPLRVDRIFHLATYIGSHSQILFRSGRGGYHDGQVLKYDSVFDVLFKNVSAIAISENFYPLEISYSSPVEIGEFRRLMRLELGDRNLYTLRGAAEVGYVLAGAMYWVDDSDGSTEEVSILVDPPERANNIEVMRA